MITTFRKTHGDREILKAQYWLEEHFSDKFTTDEVAGLVGLSPRHFKRRFNKATGEYHKYNDSRSGLKQPKIDWKRP